MKRGCATKPARSICRADDGVLVRTRALGDALIVEAFGVANRLSGIVATDYGALFSIDRTHANLRR